MLENATCRVTRCSRVTGEIEDIETWERVDTDDILQN